MSPQTLLIFSPFLAVIYVLFGLLQALRKKHQGFFAALLAFLAIAGTIAAYVTTSDPLVKARLTQFMLLNALIAFVGSLLMLLLERRDSERDSNRSYGMVGLGVSILMALGIFATPLLSGALANSAQGNAANNFGTGTLQAVRNFTPGTNGQNIAESTQSADAASGAPSPLAQALTAQTGLSTDDLTTQVSGGSTIAQLVAAHNGDLNAVTTAIVKALDQLTATGAQGAQMLSRLGSDNSAIADQIIQGQIPAQFQSRILTLLITGAAPSFGGNGNGTGGGFPPPNGNANGAPQATQEAPQPTAAPTVQPAANPAGSDVAQVLSEQTGLSADDLNTQISGGSTLAQLVSAHNGNLDTVTTAIAAALDQLVAAGGRTGQLVSRLGSDNSAIATQIVQGELPAQVQQRVVSMLITGAAPSAPANGNAAGGNPPSPSGDNNSAPTDNANQNFPPPTNVPPTPTTLPPTATVARPTPITFPTATNTPEAPAADQATVAATSAAAACTLIPNYNLNLRDQPNKDTGAVLVSIPLGTSVSADQRTSDDWYHVSYDGHNGWVDGQFASPSAGCSSLPLATPSS
ncbi:MAG: SH3 domain-containing protein [Chloroflexi bacterium]|nr:SH3 domain-containing protein [Chloroflexota bacterium]